MQSRMPEATTDGAGCRGLQLPWEWHKIQPCRQHWKIHSLMPEDCVIKARFEAVCHLTVNPCLSLSMLMYWNSSRLQGGVMLREQTSKSPGSISWDSMTGLSFRLILSQYSRASMFTFLWSMPNWQMSACRPALIIPIMASILRVPCLQHSYWHAVAV